MKQRAYRYVLCKAGLALLLMLATRLSADQPLMLDLSPHFWETFATPARTNKSFLTIMGRREFDGVPFQVDGRACLYGRCQAQYAHADRTNYPDIVGVPVGRAFAELHLLHATQWSDVEGAIIANIRLNYADGTRHELPIRYGAQVRDWQRLQSEEAEIVTDPDTKVIWRGPGIAHFKSTQRMFKSMLRNPYPAKVVTSIDFLSTGQIATYDVAAATVTDSDPSRPVSPSVPLEDPVRNFDGRVLVRVEDLSGLPIEGVWVDPNISVPDTGWATIATPFYTNPDGTGTARYPRARSTCIVFIADKDGWMPVSQVIHFAPHGGLPNGYEVIIRMAPVPGKVALHHPPSTNTSAAVEAVEAVTIVGTPAPAAAATAATPSKRVGFEMPVGAGSPMLIVDFPQGSRVRIETSDQLVGGKWKPIATITNLPFASYPFECVGDDSAQPQRFFRAVLESDSISGPKP